MNQQGPGFGSIPWAALAAQAAQVASQNQGQQGQGKQGGGKKKSGGGLGGLMSAFGGIMGGLADIGGIGEHGIGDVAPNINGMEGMTATPGPAVPSSPINVPAPAPAIRPQVAAPSVSGAGPGMEGMTLNAPEPTPTPSPTASYQPGVGQMVPVPRNAVAYGPPAPGSPFAGIQNDPNYVNRIQQGPSSLDMNNVREVHLHDRGGRTPSNGNFSKFPYHVEVQPDGSMHQTRDANQMGAGSFRSNPHSLHVAYGGNVGAMPTRPAMSSLQKIYEQMKMHNPSWTFPSHGEAFEATRNTPFRASVSGRGPAEARWRGFLR